MSFSIYFKSFWKSFKHKIKSISYHFESDYGCFMLIRFISNSSKCSHNILKTFLYKFIQNFQHQLKLHYHSENLNHDNLLEWFLLPCLDSILYINVLMPLACHKSMDPSLSMDKFFVDFELH
jgi:hypothetical protein